MNHPQLSKALQERRIPPLVFLYGEETFLLERAVRQIRDLTVAADFRDFNYTLCYGRECRAQGILELASTLPVFAERRLVWVKDAQHLAAAELDTLRPYLQDPAPETVLLFTADKIDGRRKFFQDFKKHGLLAEFKRLYDNQLPAFVREQAREAGRSFTEDALAVFCRRVGTHLQEVHGELSKLFSYLGEKTLVDVADVTAVVSNTRVDSVFDLTNALGGRKAGKALHLLARLLEEGVAPLLILTMMVRHFRQLWKASELLGQGVGRRDLPRRIGINPYFLDGVITQARQFSTPQYRRAFELFLATDQALKSSGAHPAVLLEQLILALATEAEIAGR